jgi:hypothetical protein
MRDASLQDLTQVVQQVAAERKDFFGGGALAPDT